jgi:hypothetical protein
MTCAAACAEVPNGHDMRIQLLPIVAMLTVTTFVADAQAPAPSTPEGLVTAAKRAAGVD